MTRGPKPVDKMVRFSRAIEKYKDQEGCWVWEGKTDKAGYGRLWISDHPYQEDQAHRASYEYHVGPIPESRIICHHCDNPPCVNPAHLFIGTPKDNTSDMISKDRHARGERQKHILTEEAVIDIRNRYNLRRRTRGVATRNDPNGARALAAEYGVSIWAIFDAVNGRRWAHIPLPGV